MMNFYIFFFILALLVTSLFDAYVLQSYRTNIKRYSRHQSNIVKATSDSMDDSNPVERQLEQFDLLLKNEDCDAQLASRLHMELIMTLVKSDVQDRDDDDGSESHEFPESYLSALSFIVDQTTSLREKGSPLFASANMISKKEGLSQLIKSVGSAKKQLMTSREIVEVKRKTERVLSQLMTLCIAYNSCLQSGTEKNFLFFAKALLEKTPIHDRHFALLLFGRGLLAPPYSKPNNYARNGAIREPRVDVNSVIRQPVLGLSQSFKKTMSYLGVSQPSVTARILYPFAAAAMRAYNSDLLFVSNGKKNKNDWFSTDSDDDNVTDSEVENRLSGDITEVDLKVARLLLACINEDIQAEKLRAMTGSGDELLSTLRR